MVASSPVILITGTSSGIGGELALASLKAGLRVIATARNVSAIEDLKKAGASVLQLDVAASAEELNQVAQKALAIYGQVDILINNAGIAGLGTVEETAPAELDRYIKTNFLGPVNLSKALLPHFRTRKTGTIVQVSSAAPELGMGGLSKYAASKAALNALSDSLAAEVMPFGIRVISVQPGSIKTRMMASLEGSAELYPEIDAMIKAFQSGSDNASGDAVKVAHRIVQLALSKGGLPKRLYLGNEAYYGMGQILVDRQQELEAWKAQSLGVDRDVSDSA